VVKATFDKLAQKPELKRPERTEEAAAPKKLFETAPTIAPQAPSTASQPIASTSSSSPPGVITIDYQRQRAKEMTKYFRELKAQEQVLQTGKVFGWTRNNEISNGRWVGARCASGRTTSHMLCFYGPRFYPWMPVCAWPMQMMVFL
jgi:hypothetical protein